MKYNVISIEKKETTSVPTTLEIRIVSNILPSNSIATRLHVRKFHVRSSNSLIRTGLIVGSFSHVLFACRATALLNSSPQVASKPGGVVIGTHYGFTNLRIDASDHVRLSFFLFSNAIPFMVLQYTLHGQSVPIVLLVAGRPFVRGNGFLKLRLPAIGL